MSEHKTYQRFEVARRVEHWVLFASFTLLAITGLAQKFPLEGISQAITSIFGGIESMRIIHRISAVVFLLQSAYHLVVAGYKLYVLRVEATMLPGIKDVKDAAQSFMHNIGRGKTAPKMGRYNFAEKAEYWAMVWGLISMGVTGYILWNPIITAKNVSGQVIPAAKAMHGNEAILAVLAIILWHFYNVHLKKWNWSMIRGKLGLEEMEEEHALELEQIEAGKTFVPPTKEEKSKRMRVFVPVAAVFTLLVGFGMFKFIAGEESSITTLPPAELAQIYVRQTPTAFPTKAVTPTRAPAVNVTPAAGGALTWDASIGALFGECTACHGKLGGFTATSYASVMKGSDKGVMVIAGDPDNSPLVKLMKGTHAKTFTADDLAKIIEWIKAGAKEK
jgi:formate dehydrogenase subunit gamma